MDKTGFSLRDIFIGVTVLVLIFFILDLTSSHIKIGGTTKLALDLIPMFKLPYF